MVGAFPTTASSSPLASILDYDSVPGWSRAAETAMPHAWKGGAQLRLLKGRLDQVPDGGLIVIIAPPNPFRCPGAL